MGARVSVDFSGLSDVRKRMRDALVEEQTNRLLAYAPRLLQEAYENREFKNQTLNLKDSYVWALYYQGAYINCGFLTSSKEANKPSHYANAIVEGRERAIALLSRYVSDVSGWEIILCAAVPYAETLENGGDDYEKKSRTFRVISYAFDVIRKDFSGAGKSYKMLRNV